MGLVIRIVRNRWVQGGLALVIMVACWLGYGEYRYRNGKADGIAQERAAWSSEVALARASADSSQVAANAAMSALRDSISRRNEVIARLREHDAMMSGKYREALGWYNAAKATRPDSLPLTAEQLACDSLAASCANAIAASQVVRDSLSAQLRMAERLIVRKDSVIMTEPARTSLSNREVLARQRALFKAPGRVKWAALGAGLGALATWLVAR